MSRVPAAGPAPTCQRRIGLLGGSFDPVHCAHLALAEAALAHLHLDELRLIPAAAPWQRPPLGAAPEHRAAMLELAVGPRPGVTVDRIELLRGGPSYTADTIEALTAPDRRLVFILGGDQLANFTTWHRWQDVVAGAELAVAARDGVLPPPPAELAAFLAKRGETLHPLPMPAMPVSASTVRHRLAEGEPVDDLIPAAVLEYIRAHRLYGTR